MRPAETARRNTILAVDDKPANLLAIEAVMGDEYEVVRASSGAEAIEIVKSGRAIDIVLMDVQMPSMDGFQAASHIKKVHGAEDIPIVFITAIYKEDPYIKKGYEVGGIDYFYKPFDPEILKLKVGVYATFKQRSDVLKERERQLRMSEELLSAGRKLSGMLETLPLGVIIADMDGRICQINEAVARILKSVESTESDSYGEILGWWDGSGRIIKDRRGPLSLALHGGKTSHNELLEIPCLDGTDKTVLCSASPLRRLDGAIVGAVLVLQDVTEPRKIELGLKQRITQLVKLGVEIEQSAGA